jgi:D-alanyl-D-alanine carboxypeptidase (penicillin-binding protein 5/6)
MFRALASLIASLAFAAQAAALETRATSAWIYDQTTGTVLLSKNAEEPLPPASMSKIMTLYMAFEAIRDGRLTLDEELPVSEHAMSFGGSTMFLDTTDRVRVEDLIRGIIVQSGNDACVVIAEALSPDGTEAGFARAMTERGKALGLTASTFMNSTGWPQAGHRMSMRDLGIVAERLIVDFPTFYPLFAEEEFAFDGRAPANTRNRNPVLGMGIGGDGLKTGHTREAGYGLVGSAKQGDRRIIWVVSGLDSAQARAEESTRIVNWAFRQFEARTLAEEGSVIARAEVWDGADQAVDLVVGEDVRLLVPALHTGPVAAEAVYRGPIEAPVAAGDPLGELVITLEGLPERRVPLVAARDVPSGGFTARMRTAAQVLLRQVAGAAESAL